MHINVDVLISAIFLIASVFSVIGMLWAIFTAFSKKATIFLIINLALVIIPLITMS